MLLNFENFHISILSPVYFFYKVAINKICISITHKPDVTIHSSGDYTYLM